MQKKYKHKKNICLLKFKYHQTALKKSDKLFMKKNILQNTNCVFVKVVKI